MNQNFYEKNEEYEKFLNSLPEKEKKMFLKIQRRT